MSDTQDPNVTDGDVQVAAGDKAGDVQQTLGWRAELPDPLKQHEVFTAYKTKNDLWNGHIDAVTKLKEAEGKLANSIPKLAENATDEQKAAFRAALGVPEKAEDYEIELTEGMDNSLAPWFKNTAFKLGMPKDMAKGLSNAWNGMIAEIVKAKAENDLKSHNEAVTKLQTEWGDNANTNAEIVKKAYTEIAKEIKTLEPLLLMEVDIGGKKVKVGDLPEMRETFLWIGKKMLPDSILSGTPPKEGEVKVGMNYTTMKS